MSIDLITGLCFGIVAGYVLAVWVHTRPEGSAEEAPTSFSEPEPEVPKKYHTGAVWRAGPYLPHDPLFVELLAIDATHVKLIFPSGAVLVKERGWFEYHYTYAYSRP